MRTVFGSLMVAFFAIGLVFASPPAQAQLGGVKDKLKKKAEKKAEEMMDKEEGGSAEASPEEQTTGPEGAAKGGTASAEDMTLYAKYDFVPGTR
jgi:hypothetical protein